METLEMLVVITKLRYYIDALETEVKKETPDMDQIKSIRGSIYEQCSKIPDQIQVV